MNNQVLIVGAGFAGAVIARELALKNIKTLVIDKKNHIAGNCYTRKDYQTGIMEHVYGPHIFNTNNLEVWNYVNKFSEMMPFINRVKASIPKGIFSFPINLHTINQFYKKNLNPEEAKKFIRDISDKSIRNPKNFEEQALKFIGKDLYESFFHGYTLKQWGVEPRELPSSILKRIPIRFDYNDNYYNKKYQGIPKLGYTKLIQNILNHKNISIKLNTSWNEEMRSKFSYIFFSGPIDELYNFKFGKLGYRTVYWEKDTVKGDFQGNAGINYPSIKDAFTRIYEHKHFTPWNSFEKSIIFKEFSKETENKDIPYYPKRLKDDMLKFNRYKKLAKKEKNLFLTGRLGTYRYLDMEDVIKESIELVKKISTIIK